MIFPVLDAFGHKASAYLDLPDAVTMAELVLCLAGMVERGELR